MLDKGSSGVLTFLDGIYLYGVQLATELNCDI